MKNLPADSLETIKATLRQIEANAVMGQTSIPVFSQQLHDLLAEALTIGRTTKDPDRRRQLQFIATRIGDQIGRLGHLYPKSLIDDYQSSDAGIKGVAFTFGTNPVIANLTIELMEAMGIAVEAYPVETASHALDLSVYKFAVSVVSDKLDKNEEAWLSDVWGTVVTLEMPRAIYIAKDQFSVPKIKSLVPLDDTKIFTDDQSLEESLREFLYRAASKVTSEVVTRSVDAIPAPPVPYVVHPYGFVGVPIGRENEFAFLNEQFLFVGPAIVVLRAIGGNGKTSVAWEWLRRISNSPQASFSGIIWWSFYEADASYERFLAHCLAYLEKRPLAEVSRMSRRAREEAIRKFCVVHKILVIFDGLERELVAYSDNYYATMVHSADSKLNTDTTERECANPWLSQFLKNATDWNISILVTTRLLPTELEGTAKIRDLEGLTPELGERLWRSVHHSQTPLDKNLESVLLGNVLKQLDGNPLAIKILAATVASDPKAGGNLEKWLDQHGYQLRGLYDRISQHSTHILAFAMHGLGQIERLILELASCCYSRVPVSVVKACLNRNNENSEAERIDTALKTLQNRHLLGITNQGDTQKLYLHPLVSGAVRDGTPRDKLMNTMLNMRDHFRQAIEEESPPSASNISDDSVNLLYIAIQLQDYADAAKVLESGLANQLLHRHSDQRRTTDVLSPILVTAIQNLSSQHSEIAYIYNVLGISSRFLGEVQRSERAFDAMIRVSSEANILHGLTAAYYNGSSTARASGKLGLMFDLLVKAIRLTYRKASFQSEFDLAKSITFLGRAYLIVGKTDDAIAALKHARQLFAKLERSDEKPSIYCFNETPKHFAGVVNAYDAECHVRLGDTESARKLATQAMESARVNNYAVDFIRANRLLAAADAIEGQWDSAISIITPALAQAQLHDRTEENIALSILLTRVYLGAGNLKNAVEAIKTPLSFPLLKTMDVLESEVYLTAAEVHFAQGESGLAAEYATQAYVESNCDGYPFRIEHVHQAAVELLSKLNVTPPKLKSAQAGLKIRDFHDILDSADQGEV